MLIQLFKADPCTLKSTDESGGIRICAVELVRQQQTVVLTLRRDDMTVDEQCAVDTEPPEQLRKEDGEDYGRQRSAKTHQRLLENFVDEADRICSSCT